MKTAVDIYKFLPKTNCGKCGTSSCFGFAAKLATNQASPDECPTMTNLTFFWLSIYAKVCRQIKVDAIHIWEDMSGKNGSLISPKMVREFMVPNYKKIKAFAEAQGIRILSLDTGCRLFRANPVVYGMWHQSHFSI